MTKRWRVVGLPLHAKREVAVPRLTSKKIALLRDLIEIRRRLAGAPLWLIRLEWWAERALRWGRGWYRRWALLRLAIAISVSRAPLPSAARLTPSDQARHQAWAAATSVSP